MIGALSIWLRTTDVRLRAGALAAATLLVTPYLRPYDLVLLVLPLAALIPSAAGARGWPEKVVIVAAWVLPAVLTFAPPPIQLGAIVSAALMGLVVWRAASQPATATESAALEDG